MSVFVSARLARNHLQTAYSLQGKQCFFEAIPGVLGRSVNFNITIKISIKTARVSKLSVSSDYDDIELF